jgi:uncharacterized protein YqjF (DUF2071 family)
MSKPFLTAAWKNLVLINYSVAPATLKPYLPYGVELDSFNGIHYLSLVGFMFRDTTVMGMKIPFHINFPEVNLRFYVKYNDLGKWKRGVVFLSEIVPKYAVAFLANSIYKENYRRMPMRVIEEINAQRISTSYEWKFRNNWNQLAVSAPNQSISLQEGSEEEFITEHFWGYAKYSAAEASEYHVAHPRWNMFKVDSHTVRCDFKSLYGEAFSPLNNQEPVSVFFAEGSSIEVYSKRLVSPHAMG